MDKSVKTAVQPFDPLEAVTVKEVAELLRVSEPTVVKYIKLGELPSVTIGRCRRIRRSAVEDFLEIHSSRDYQVYTPVAGRDSIDQVPSSVPSNEPVCHDFSDDGGEVIPF